MKIQLARCLCISLVAGALVSLQCPYLTAQESIPIRVACLGDSITAGARVDAKSESYPARLQALLGDTFQVRNFGIGGATLLKTGRPRIWQKLDDVLKFQPHVAIISLGTNDTVGGKRKNWEQIDRFEADYTALITALSELPTKPRIVICTPTAMVLDTPGLADDRLANLQERRPRLQELCQRIRKLAARHTTQNVSLLELNAVLQDHPELLTKSDGVHPNAQGYLAIAHTVAKHIQSRPKKPNIVLIFVDDMGYGDLGCYGNKLHKTPNIDRLATEGQRWTSFYSSGATCVPSRRGLMTGRHPSLMGRANLAEHRDKLLPAMLKQHGYATAILGKWHLAGYPKDFTTSPMHPLECGFDSHFGTPGSNDVPAPQGKIQNREVFDTCDKFTFQVPLIRGREVVEFPVNQELLTSRYTTEAINWINQHKEEPFFLYLAHNMPHAPVFASEKFQGTSRGGRFGDVVEEIDWSVGQVMQAIQEAKIDEKTLVVFTSDNGPWTMFGPHGGTAAPLRGEKGTAWEGGYRIPGIFRWPGKIKPGVVDGLAANLDLYATFSQIVGGTAPAKEVTDQPGFISKDLTGVLFERKPSPRQQWFYQTGAIAFRSGNYKIHLSTKDRSSNPDTRKREAMRRHDPPLLFDLSNDLSEQKNIAAEHPEVVSRLLKEMNAFRGEP